MGRPPYHLRFADSRIGHMCLIDRQKVEVAEEYFRKHGAASTIFGRLVPAVRQLISIPAGLAGMHVGKFLLYTTIGAGIWNTVLATIGWGIYQYTDYKTTQDVYQQALKYSHELGYIIFSCRCYCSFPCIQGAQEEIRNYPPSCFLKRDGGFFLLYRTSQAAPHALKGRSS